MSQHVSHMMFHGFLDERQKLTKRYPLFYSVTERGGVTSSMADTHLNPIGWSPLALLYADACYTLWVQTIMLEFIAIRGGLQTLQKASLHRWYDLPEFILFSSVLTVDAILDAMHHPERAIAFVDHREAGVFTFADIDVPLLKDTHEWKIIVPGHSSEDEKHVQYDMKNASSEVGTLASFVQSEHIDTEKALANLLDSLTIFGTPEKRFGKLFEWQVDRILRSLERANPAADFPEVILHAWKESPGESECRCDVFTHLLIHVAVISVVMKAAPLNMDAIQEVVEDSPILQKYERGFLDAILVAMVKARASPGAALTKVEEDKMVEDSSGPVEPLFVSPGKAPHATTFKTKVFIHEVPVSGEGRSRHNLSKPHVYAFFSHGVSIPSSSTENESDLERMYAGAAGCMRRAVYSSSGALLTAELELAYIGGASAPDSRPLYLCFMIFYEVDGDSTRIIPTYSAVSRGYLKLPQNMDESFVRGAKVTTFAGPMTSGYSIHTDHVTGEIGGIKKDFEYVADCVLTLGGENDVQLHTTPDEAPTTLLFDKNDERNLNEYTEHLYQMSEQAHLKSAQSFIYKGIPGVIAPLNVGSFFTPAVTDMPTLNRSLERALARIGISEDDFIALLNRDELTKWEIMRVKHLVIETLNLVSVLDYTNDRVFDVNVDVHQDVRLTNSGDCEDFAWALYSILRRLTEPYFEPPWYDGQSKGMSALIEKVRKEKLKPVFVSMYIDYPTSNMHSAVIFHPAEKTKFGNYMFEGTGPHHGDFCSTQDFSAAEKESVKWYDSVHRAIKAQNRAAKDRIFTMYPPPLPVNRAFDTETDEHFYRGFLGGVLDGEYVRFVEKGRTIDSLREMGIDVCTVINEDAFDIVAVPTTSEQSKPYYTQTVEEMKYLAGFMPPLPSMKSEGMPAEVKNAVDIFKRNVLTPIETGENTGLLMNCASVFYNLHGRTSGDVETAANALLAALKTVGMPLGRARVHAFSNFAAAWTIEIDIYRE